MSELAKIFEMLPACEQEEAIVACLEKMFACTRWQTAGAIVAAIEQMPGYPELKTRALYVGMKCRLRQREYVLALHKYESLHALCVRLHRLSLAAEALEQMAIWLLPGRTEQIGSFWTLLRRADPGAPAARDALARIGVMLARSYANLGNFPRAKEIREIVRRDLCPLAPSLPDAPECED